ncbi:hypothetical protein [Natrialba chahannaoensis]|uniref:hypothetical protein n=1 Tax=Natrialba chahannaoensis TaxID=68911 RepID=UPI000677AF5B|nr:hypothetical protein [Natrialba chahannaoensis]
MVSDRDTPLQTSDGNQPTMGTSISRRRVIHSGLATTVLVAGCLDDVSSGGPSDGGDGTGSDEGSEAQSTDDGEETDGEGQADAEADDSDSDDGPVSVVYAFLNAAVEEDLDRMSELSHSQNPLDPAAWVEDGWEFRGGGDEEEIEEIEIAVINDDPTVTDIFELEGAAFWFEEDALAETLEDADMALVEITADDPTEDDMLWLLATENGDWRYLFAAPVDDTPDDPEEAFEEPIEDEDDDVVVEIDWEYDSPTSDIQQAAVTLTEERGIDVNRIEIKSTIEGASTGAYDRDDDEFTASWDTGATLYIPYDTDGDQIVVTAINEAENESTVVHREHYEPEGGIIEAVQARVRIR